MNKKDTETTGNSESASIGLLDLPSFTHMTTIELVMMQKQCERFPEDKQFRNAILIELGKRQKNK